MQKAYRVFDHANGAGCQEFLAWLDGRLNTSAGVENKARRIFTNPVWRHDVSMSCIAPSIIRIILENDIIDCIEIFDAATVGNNGENFGGTRNFDHAQRVQWPPFAGLAYQRSSSRLGRAFSKLKIHRSRSLNFE